MKLKKLAYYLLLIIFYMVISGQDCLRYEREGYCLLAERIGYSMYHQSTSLSAFANKTVKAKLTLLGNREYLITLCTEKRFYPVHYKIIDEKEDKVLYDNQQDDYLESIGFILDRTRNVIIEAEALAEKAKLEDRVYPKCIGIYIQYRFP